MVNLISKPTNMLYSKGVKDRAYDLALSAAHGSLSGPMGPNEFDSLLYRIRRKCKYNKTECKKQRTTL